MKSTRQQVCVFLILALCIVDFRSIEAVSTSFRRSSISSSTGGAGGGETPPQIQDPKLHFNKAEEAGVDPGHNAFKAGWLKIKKGVDFERNADYAYEKKDDKDGVPGPAMFFFMLNANGLFYYSKKDSQTSIVDSMTYDEVLTAKDDPANGVCCENVQDLGKTEKGYCIMISSKIINKEPWTVCGKDAADVDFWYRAIAEKTMWWKFTNGDVNKPAPKIVVGGRRETCNSEFKWLDHGKSWNCLCTSGRQQSPIDFDFSAKGYTESEDDAIEWLYEGNGKDTTISNTGKGIKFEAKGEDGFGHLHHVSMATHDYIAKGFEVRIPSEHQIDGKPYAMEIQILHEIDTEEDKHKTDRPFAILSVLFEAHPDQSENEFLLRMDPGLWPSKQDAEPIERYLDLGILLPNHVKKSFFSYDGSRTTPMGSPADCTEDIKWFVLSTPIKVNPLQVEEIKKALGIPEMNPDEEDEDDLGNNRAIQKLNGRQVIYHEDIENDDCSDLRNEIQAKLLENQIRAKQAEEPEKVHHWVAKERKYFEYRSGPSGPDAIPPEVVPSKLRVPIEKKMEDKDFELAKQEAEVAGFVSDLTSKPGPDGANTKDKRRFPILNEEYDLVKVL
eukprot:GILI01000614.1.p1 GENE.GILI01000614.1~~GILI01000614.1.p1  ORF type:complete len:613 (+),score=257.55 GILI01000614.1:75-1913(+)